MTNKELAKKFRDTYEMWKKDSLKSSGYFVVFNGFVENRKLEQISGNALKLYIYLGIYANNKTGEVWHSNQKIAKYFNKSERTIRLWIQELESLNLIRKMQLQYNGEPHIFLQPYMNTDSYQEKNKYLYTYRLKNKNVREKIDLRVFDEDIALTLEKLIKSCYVNVKKDFFTITSYTPVNQSILRNVNGILKDNVPHLLDAINSFVNMDSEDGVIYNSVFERVRKNSAN